ncbi:Signal transduction histidine kinase regulating C4-dicarboxylate transport system (PDB:4GCZ) [Commensalibacter communis]|uniref:ATP-binding response regulator n=1 Tax=Commensalibacter communis TaxID=2972786 RepID=UPI0022FF919A|nr:ATP-binding protein [Commensalibacter communis]CAI3927252.1 Signal transduction histidine kinase regulating C4-dicarboxylate transport system (PDB:4GCZ) [Commensalibacter communis]CAI3932095.1 Signal transduction histidine kinase regulating C4-dicarboxylate transport system (PDB:4GCZ) [Commensalibacter communis]
MNALPAILVVDDDPKILQEFKQMLEDQFCVYITQSPHCALDMIKRGVHFSAILYNYFMPVMYGNVFFARVRSITVATRILLSSKDRTDFLISALNQGGISFFISKPLDPLEVKEIVQRAVARSQYRRQLRHEQILLKGLLDHLPYGLAFKDEQGKFTKMNELAAARRGLTVQECLGKTEEEIEPSFKPQELSAFKERLQKEERFVATLEVPAADIHQPSQWFLITRLLLGRVKGEIAHSSVIMELDITEQKMLEAKLQHAEKLQALGTMAGSIAHDFNNLLTTMMGSLELSEQLLMQDQLQEKQIISIKRLLVNTLAAAQKGAVLTERLLSFSRRKKLSLQEVDVVKQVKENYELLSQTLSMRHTSRLKGDKKAAIKESIYLDIRCQLPMGVLIKTDPSQLELAVMNLCINSADAMPHGGKITVILHKETITDPVNHNHQLSCGDYVVITVKDEGEGMSAETIAHIFEPFFTTKEAGWGTGLGLAMVYGFAQQSGGDVMVKSQAGVGTAISIYLPILVN